MAPKHNFCSYGNQKQRSNPWIICQLFDCPCAHGHHLLLLQLLKPSIGRILWALVTINAQPRYAADCRYEIFYLELTTCNFQSQDPDSLLSLMGNGRRKTFWTFFCAQGRDDCLSPPSQCNRESKWKSRIVALIASVNQWRQTHRRSHGYNHVVGSKIWTHNGQNLKTYLRQNTEENGSKHIIGQQTAQYKTWPWLRKWGKGATDCALWS